MIGPNSIIARSPKGAGTTGPGPNSANTRIVKSPLTPQDEANIRVLEERGRGLLRVAKNPSDGDDYGSALDASQARQKLEEGEAFVVTSPQIGNFEKARLNVHGDSYAGKKDGYWAFSDSLDLLGEAQLNHTRREGVVIDNARDLNRLLQADGLQEPTDLTSEEAAAAEILRDSQGRIDGTMTAVDDSKLGYFFRLKPDKSGTTDGLYDPSKKEGGFLGIGSHPDRLTPYEALEKLKDGQPVNIIRDERLNVIASFDDLMVFRQNQERELLRGLIAVGAMSGDGAGS